MVRKPKKQPSRARVSLTQADIDELHAIGAALAAERDLDRLLVRILEKCRQIVRADAGTLFLGERNDAGAVTQLRFKLAQNDSVPLHLEEFLIPADRESLVGYVAVTRTTLRLADVYSIPKSYPFSFNRDVDRSTGYRSKSVLSVPMSDHQEQLIGVVQLWNKKRNGSVRLTSRNVAQQVMSFSAADQSLLTSLAAQAAIAIENARLYGDIENLFEGFIRASAVAIEARDPTTRGHSERVAALTVALAESVNGSNQGSFRDVRYTPEQLQEIKYAALLHDFGKIGVRENLLVKSKKLYSWEMVTILERLDLLRRNVELDIARRKIEHLSRNGQSGDSSWLEMDRSLAERLKEIQEVEELIRRCNEPTVLTEDVTASLAYLAGLEVDQPGGSVVPLLTDDQMARLSIPKGSLSEAERRAVEEHVTHTYDFLTRIPWTRDLKEVPNIARCHHEKLDGSGYPQGAKGERIPLPSRMMAIADVFDALASRDRPYKRAVPLQAALEVLRTEAKEGKLDADLVALFIENRIYERTVE